MNESAIINDLNLMEAHFNEGSRIAARLRKKLQPLSKGRSKKKGLAPEAGAKIIGKKRARQYKNAIA